MLNIKNRHRKIVFYGCCTTLILITSTILYVYVTENYNIGLLLSLIIILGIIIIGIIYSNIKKILYEDFDNDNVYLFILPGVLVMLAFITLQNFILIDDFIIFILSLIDW